MLTDIPWAYAFMCASVVFAAVVVASYFLERRRLLRTVMPSREEFQQEVDRNYAAFAVLLGDLMKDHAGKYALLRSAKLVDIFDTAGDAKKFAHAQFADGLFSIQQITDRVVDLGYFSHA